MQSQISKLEDFGWFLVMIAVGALMGWFLMYPFSNFVGGLSKIDEATTTPVIPVDLIPPPINDGHMLEIEQII